jgi:hypothetical protein
MTPTLSAYFIYLEVNFDEIHTNPGYDNSHNLCEVFWESPPPENYLKYSHEKQLLYYFYNSQ